MFAVVLNFIHTSWTCRYNSCEGFSPPPMNMEIHFYFFNEVMSQIKKLESCLHAAAETTFLQPQ